MGPVVASTTPNLRKKATVVSGLIAIRRPLIVVVHLILITAAYWGAHLIRFDATVPAQYVDRFMLSLPLLLLCRLATFGYFGLYQGLWRYTSIADLLSILKATSVGSLVFLAMDILLVREGFSRSIFLLDWLLCVALIAGLRVGLRAVRESTRLRLHPGARRALVVGGGDAGENLIRLIQGSPDIGVLLVGVLDDDLRLYGRSIRGVRVWGSPAAIAGYVQKLAVDEVLLAIPSATVEERRRIVDACKASGVVVRTVPPLRDLVSGKASLGELRRVEPEDVLGRERVQIDLDLVRSEITGKRILVTGAAGSIGFELCRQVASFEPEALILYERAESNLFFTTLELQRKHPDLWLVPVIGDILDQQKVGEVFASYRPQIVYHAAAYKHVPLMEDHPLDAVKNNVFGTEIVARAAEREGSEKFVLISTDKAVAPVGVMGMTKRIAEAAVLALPKGVTVFTAVRFGNVLGSEGSVLPIFRWQLASGGPLTVTHEDATRYFMLISEAAQLVLQAGAMARGGEVYFLDMGEPVSIMKLAEEFIHLAAGDSAPDVGIEVTGLRPGERLSEELTAAGETLVATDHSKIAMALREEFDPTSFEKELDALRYLVEQRDAGAVVERLRRLAERI